MDQFLALYVDELRNMKRGLLIIFAIIIGYMILVSIYPFQLLSSLPVSSFLLRLGMKLFYLFPILFAFSLYKEEKNQPLYQADSLKVQKSKQLLFKYFVLVDAMILMTLIVFLHNMLMMSGILPYPDTINNAAIGDIRVLFSAILHIFSTPFILLSLVCTAWGVMQKVKRFKVLFGLAVMAAGWLLYDTLFGLSNTVGKTFAEETMYIILLTLFLGAVYCAVGVFLDKRVGGE
ncbi:hypothetical protein ES708_12304 [subsurface metagenome]